MEIAQMIVEQLNLDEQSRSDIESTAMLCKADLVTQMVYEFPELQGVMAEKYALISGESAVVARGIFEHYLPRNAGDILPETITGQVVGIADRLDTLVGIFGLGMLPTGSSDPFALRRAANAIISIIWSADFNINLLALIEQIAQDFVTSHPDKPNPVNLIKDFFLQRLQTLLIDDLRIDYDLVNAVLGENDPEYKSRALENLLDTRLAQKGDLDTTTLEAKAIINTELFEQSSEPAFYDALIALIPETISAREQRDYQRLVTALTAISPLVADFFDGENSVLVMAEKESVRRNRLNLLGLLRNHARVLADFGAIVKG
jgi:glycyl-tRNA synthetase beta chain